MRLILLAGAALLIAASPGLAQHEHAASSTNSARVGSVKMKSEGNAAAQAPFLRGLALLHNFEYSSAAEAFRAAQAADPDFVLAYWGEAMTYNHPLWAEQDAAAARAVLTRLGPTPAARKAKARSPREAQWLDAVEALYGNGSKYERDFAYTDRMKVVFDADPNDIDARSFYALSIMGTAHNGRDIGLYMQAAALLEEAFPAHPDHPGVVHYLIHTYDDPAHAPLGERAASRYALVAPDAGHAQHMVSHIYLALGRWPQVELANRQAMAVVNGQRAAQGKPATSCGHYNEWLAYALDQQGKDSQALVDACKAEALGDQSSVADKSVLGGSRNLITNWAQIATRHGVDTGRWPATALPVGDKLAVARFTLAYADLLAARRSPARAEAALGKMKAQRESIAAAIKTEWPDDDESLRWFDRAIAQGEAAVALSRGEREEGLRLLREAAAAESRLPVPFGPPVLAKPSAEMLGEELLADGRKAEAAAAFRKALEAAPNRRLSVQGLATASANAALASGEVTH
ncbi:hypothetical protein [Sphingomonas daechungensis]|uniref:hypothetical protein n=1 Tax=Sphingomonas daechungensis TaxID=1176646 RepID=UPI003783271E